MGPAGPFGSIQVKVPPYFEEEGTAVVGVVGTAVGIAAVVDTGLETVEAVVELEAGDDVANDVCVCVGVVVCGCVELDEAQPETNNAARIMIVGE